MSEQMNEKHRNLYASKAWRNLRRYILARDPLCKLQITPECKAQGGAPATNAEHMIDPEGDPNRFFESNNLRGACKHCSQRARSIGSGLVFDDFVWRPRLGDRVKEILKWVLAEFRNA